MLIKFKVHGVRGSVSNPSPNVSRHGGNTSCYEIEVDEHQIVLDTGTGFHNVELFREKKNTIVIFSHFHHDHLQGLSFNKHLYNPISPIFISSALCSSNLLRDILETYYSGHYFPIDLMEQLSHLKIIEFNELQRFLANTIKIDSVDLRHPGGSAGYRFQVNDKKIVTLFDNEYHEDQRDLLLDFCYGADLVVWDGMFTEEELISKKGWGHSSIERAQEFAELASLKRMIISHHSPDRTDDELDVLSKSLQKNLEFAREGQIYEF